MNAKKILNNKKINQIISRIAYQVYENFINEDEVVVVGIKEKGFKVAQKLVEEMQKLKKESSSILLASAIINKQKPTEGNILFSLNKDDFKGKTVVLVDDVLNSGKTMLHVIADLTRFDCKIIRTVVLVDRKHRLYPVRADFVGLSLSTTLEEHIEVEFENQEMNAFLKN